MGLGLVAWGVAGWWTLLALVLSAFVLLTIVFDTARAIHARRGIAGEALGTALGTLVRRNPRRYGGFVVHLGVALIVLGIAASMGASVEREATLGAGESPPVRRAAGARARPG